MTLPHASIEDGRPVPGWRRRVMASAVGDWHGSLTGPTWLTGGEFGAEGSIVTVALCLVATAVLLRLRHARAPTARGNMAPWTL